MMDKKKFFILLFLLFFQNVFAVSPVVTLQNLLTSITSLKADFTQSMKDKNAAGIQESSGKLIILRPDRFRWEVNQPTKQLIIANNSKVWIYDPDLEQVTIRHINQEMGDSPARLLSHPENLEKDFVVKITKKNAENISFLLIPRDENSLLMSIQLGFKNDHIQYMVLQDRIGHTTMVEFYNVQLNSPVINSLFVLKIPKQVDVIDETKQESSF